MPTLYFRSKSIKLVLILLLTLALFYLGYYRKPFFAFLGMQLAYTDPDAPRYPVGWENLIISLVKRPEWIISLVYNQGFGLISSLIIQIWFGKNSYFKKTWWVYFLLEISCVTLIFVLGIAGLRTVNHYLVVRLRNFIQSPLYAMVMYLYFKRVEKEENYPSL